MKSARIAWWGILSGLLSVAAPDTASAQSTIVWGSSGGSAWLTAGNWTGGVIPATTDIAQFAGNPTAASGVGINMNGSTNNGANNQAVGTIWVTNSRANNHLVGNNSTTANGTLTLNGASVNSQANTILADFASNASTLTIQDTQSTGNKTMAVALGQTTNFIQLGAGTSSTFGNTIAIASAIGQVNSGSSISILGNGTSTVDPGTLSLGGSDTFTGGITVGNAAGDSAGRLTFTAVAAMPATGTITVNSNSQLLLATALTFTPTTTISLNSSGTVSDSGAIRATANTTFANALSVASNSTVFTNSGITLTANGALSGAFQLTTAGSGTFALGGSSGSYSGVVQVTAGTLLANNATSSTGTGAVAVNGGTLGGTGTIAPIGTGVNAVNVTSGTVTAGTGTSATTLTIGSGAGAKLTLASGTTFQPKLFGTGVTDISLINITGGTASINTSALLKLDLSSITSTQRDTLRSSGARDYTVLSTATVMATGFQSGNFSTIDPSALFSAGEWTLGNGGAGGTAVLLHFQPVPEPASVLAVFLGGAGAVGWWRRRRATAKN